MSKRKNGSGDDLPLGDHSSYMAEPLLPLADIQIKVKGGAVLPAHAMKLVETCGAIAGSSELFVGATPDRPAALSSPFDEFEEADVARFLKCIYTATGNALQAEDARGRLQAEDVAAVVRLAHALDAAPVLAAAQRHTLAALQYSSTYPYIVEANELAALCGWDDVHTAGVATLVDGLQKPLGSMETSANVALSDLVAFDHARNLIQACPQELAARAFGTLAANFRRLYAEASDAVRNSLLSPAEAVAASRAAADGDALESRCGRFVAAIDVGADWDDEHVAPFKSHGLEWKLNFLPNGDMLDRRPCVSLELLSGWPKKVRYQVGLVNWMRCSDQLLGEWDVGETVLTEGDRWATGPPGLLTAETFRDPAAGWVNFHGHAAPFVRILEVSDPAPV